MTDIILNFKLFIMNRLSSQPKTNVQIKMTPIEYMLHKNIPIPNQAKHPHFDLEPNSHKSDPI